jgi:GABA permease
MRIPVKSEGDAFRLAYGLAILIGVSVALGAAIAPVVGIALFGGGVLGAFLLEFLVKDPEQPQPLREASQASRMLAARSPGRRILVVANQTVGGEELKNEILARGEPRPELRIVAPVLCSRVHYLASDIDGEMREARERLDETLRWAHDEGFEAVGTVSDATPLQAVEDELRRFPADELIVSTHVPERSHWLESGVVQRARNELDIPVTHVIVDVARQLVTIAS